MELKNQHRLKDKEVEKYHGEIRSKLGDAPFGREEKVDTADCNEKKVLLIDKEPVATFFEDTVFPTIDGLLSMEATKRYVTVDMGAVKFVYNGADIMAPGIVDADESIGEGDLVWVRDIEHEKPLAVGRAMTHGKEMIQSEKGKVVKSLHHVGDEMFD
ncbi:MAG: RNA-binding protein [Candidatus Thermoplasmatota archaeon]